MDEWIEAQEDEIEFIDPSPKVMIEDFLEHKGVQHLRQLLEHVEGNIKSRPAERE